MKIITTILVLAIITSSSLTAQTTYVPDDNFEQALIDLGYDTGALDNYVLTANIENVTTLDVAYKNIADLTGIADFTALSELRCNNNLLTDLNLTQNKALTRMFCYSNQLENLDIRNGYNTNIPADSFPIPHFRAENNPDLYCIFVDDYWYSALNWHWIDDASYFVVTETQCYIASHTYVPDDNFEQALIDLGYDDVLDNYVATSNIKYLTLLDVANKNITDLKGIEDFIALTTLYCNTNQLTSLDLTQNTAIKILHCYNNQLTSLDVSTNTALENLACSDNQIASIDLTQNSALHTIDVANNQLTSLDVKNGYNTNITIFYATNNPNLTCIFVDDAVYSTTNWQNIDATATFVETQAACDILGTYVPDDNFEQALIDLGYDDVLDNIVLTANIENITILDVINENISDLTGIAGFTALTELYCGYNNLTSLDLSVNTNLQKLYCGSNQITSIDLNQNIALMIVSIYGNQLTGIDLSKNIALEELSVLNNQLTNLDVRNGTNTIITSFNATNNPNLTCIFVDDAAYSTANWTDIDAASTFVETQEECNILTGTTYVPDDNFEQALIDLGYDTGALDDYVPTANIENLTTLDVSAKSIADLTGIEDFISLTNLSCYSNQLTSLDVSTNTALTHLRCYSNQLTSLDVSVNTSLIDLDCSSNQLTNLNVSANTNLEYLYCYLNQLTSLDVSANTALTHLSCRSNQLTSLDVSFNTALTYLICSNNQLTSLDVSQNIALATLSCFSNQLTSLDVSANTSLTYLNCGSNQLTNLDVSTNTSLTDLFCYSNQLTSLDVSANTSLINLSCRSNQLTNLNVSANTNLEYLYCYSNQLTSLDVRNGNNVNFTNFNSGNNPNLTCIFVDDAAYSTANWTDIDAASTFVETQAECDILTYYTYVPDDNFEQALIDLGYDTGALDDYVPTVNIENVTTLDVSNKNIVDLTGIEDFTSLTNLSCYSNQLTSLDVSANTSLTYLSCYSNQLTSLDVSTNTSLTYLNCFSNQLTSLDVSTNTSLTDLYCHSNQLTSLDVSTNTNLEDFYCYSNQLTSLDVSANTSLTNLSCHSNQLTSLDVSANTSLTNLYCYSNQLTSLDVSANTSLMKFGCYSNQLTNLDIRNGNNTIILSFNATSNTDLTCIFVDDAAYSTTNWTDIDAASTFVETQAQCDAIRTTYVPDDNFEQALIDLGYDTGALDDYVPTVNIENVTTLDVSNKNIADLTGIEDFTALSNLDCHFNQLTSLDVSVNVNLTALNCGYNNLTSLDVRNGNNTNFSSFSTEVNYDLTCIFVDDAAYSTANWTNIEPASTFVETQADCDALTATTYVPDDNFEQALIDLGYDTGALDDYVPTANIENLTTLDVSAKSIADLTGIEDFISLTNLSCQSNELTSLDVSVNTSLTYLFCYSNQLTSLDVSANTSLTNLSCYSNQLTSLDVSANTSLTNLSCYSNQLTSLDITQNTALTILYCNSNQLTSLDVSANTNLEYLYCHTNLITSLDVSANTSLRSLYCNSNQLTSLDVSQNIALATLYCYSNQLTSLDVSANTSLTDLFCYLNQLTSLDISQNIALATLYCNSNQLTSLDITQNTALTILYCYSNQLTSLDVSTNTSLTFLSCHSNQLTSLDVSTNTSLTDLFCYSNQLTSLDVRNGNNANFTAFYSGNNPNLTCIFVDDAAYSTANWTNIDAASTFVENEAECNVLGVDDLLNSSFTIYPNPMQDSFRIQTELEIISIEIVDIYGKFIKTINSTNRVNINELNVGVYFIRITTPKGKGIYKIIKK